MFLKITNNVFIFLKQRKRNLISQWKSPAKDGLAFLPLLLAHRATHKAVDEIPLPTWATMNLNSRNFQTCCSHSKINNTLHDPCFLSHYF